jgi:hypothetical protein
MEKVYVEVISENGYEGALEGLALNKNQSIEKMPDVAEKLSNKDGGHNKFLESIHVWIMMRLPRYMWQQLDTYRVGVTKQSQSTMHTIMKTTLSQDDFYMPIPQSYVNYLNELVEKEDLELLKNCLPEGFLQTRQVTVNYKSLRNIFIQRKHHKMKLWRKVVEEIKNQVLYPELLP